jgi:hypothetical protein
MIVALLVLFLLCMFQPIRSIIGWTIVIVTYLVLYQAMVGESWFARFGM